MTMFPEIRRYYDLAVEEMNGYTEEDIRAAEKSIGCVLPKVLRQYYLELGKHKINHNGQDNLMSLERMVDCSSKNQEMIFFFEENQNVFNAAFLRNDSKEDDPPVYIYEGCLNILDNKLLDIHEKGTAHFLRSILHYLAFYYYPYGLLAPMSKEVLLRIQEVYHPSDETIQGWFDFKIYAGSDDSFMILFGDDGSSSNPYLNITAKTENDFFKLLKPLSEYKITWDNAENWYIEGLKKYYG